MFLYENNHIKHLIFLSRIEVENLYIFFKLIYHFLKNFLLEQKS